MPQIPLEGDRRRRVGTMSAGLKPMRPSEKALNADEFIVLGRVDGKIIKEFSTKEGRGRVKQTGKRSPEPPGALSSLLTLSVS
jgi:hypothetical protein